uniref:G-protein coupled receptors family 1 profile domain-containing protein n=1 Tax=Sus scrofa TaxID=9823 RepID=A0A8D1DP88_PIG
MSGLPSDADLYRIQMKSMTEVTMFIMIAIYFFFTLIGNFGLPLLYSIRMSPRVYVPLIIFHYIVGILHGTLHTVATFSISFWASNETRHVFCHIPSLLSLFRPDTHTNQLPVSYFWGYIEISTILIILISYDFILQAILREHSAEKRRKAFSTCDSHLTGVLIFHGTVLFMYVRPTSSYALDHDMMVSVFYTIVTPMLNSIIYSLRNKDVKEAVKSVWEKLICK